MQMQMLLTYLLQFALSGFGGVLLMFFCSYPLQHYLEGRHGPAVYWRQSASARTLIWGSTVAVAGATTAIICLTIAGIASPLVCAGILTGMLGLHGYYCYGNWVDFFPAPSASE